MTRLTCLVLFAALVSFFPVESVPCDGDPCKSSPCQNGGVCDPTPSEGNRYTCKCPTGFLGFYCEVISVCGNADPCDPSPCRNQGKCATTGVDGQGYERYKCTCADGYAGIDCEVSTAPKPPPVVVTTTTTTTPPPVTQPADPCKPSPCKNNEKCNPTPGGGKPYTCSCPTEFSGCACDLVKPIQCPTGFRYASESKSCFKIITSRNTWDGQSAKCRSLHPQSDLAVISSKAEDDKIDNELKTSITKDELESCKASGFFIGLQLRNRKDCNSGRIWKSVSTCDAPHEFTDWNQGEPNCSTAHVEDCVHIWPLADYKWNDIECGTQACAVCEVTLAGST